MASSSKKSIETSTVQHEFNHEQTLGLVSLSLMQKLSQKDPSMNWLLDDNQDRVNLLKLRNRLELIELSIKTGAPLSTSEVTALIGAKPGKTKVERGGISATKISRNVWKISKLKDENNYWRN
tara:strand:+ start:1779 stop:2147 length:369 start_codon:yes stop_codon:yes gene_type:complete